MIEADHSSAAMRLFSLTWLPFPGRVVDLFQEEFEQQTVCFWIKSVSVLLFSDHPLSKNDGPPLCHWLRTNS